VKLDTQFKVVNLMYWVCIVLAVTYAARVGDWTMWIAFLLGAWADVAKTKNIRVWERYNISQEKKGTK
jgi:cell shape-determining protein MreD